MREEPLLNDLTVKLPVFLHYLGLLMFLATITRLALVMWSIEKGLKEKLFDIELKVIEGVIKVLDPDIV